jgi:hypothetical protein
VVEINGLQQPLGDLFCAVQDHLDRGSSDQVRQAADHPTGAGMKVGRQRGQRAWLVVVQPQRVFQGRDQALSLGGARERLRGDQTEPARDLPAPGAGEQPSPLDVDPGIDEGGRDALGEVLERIGDLGLAEPVRRAT